MADDFQTHDLYVGGKTGAFKGVNVKNGQIYVRNIQNVKILNPKDEITVLRWDGDEENNILIGTVDQQVKIYDREFKAYSTCLETKLGSGPIVGLCRYEGSLVTCSESGHVKVWKYDEGEHVLETGQPVSCMQSFPQNPGIIATGGKNNDLKLWNLESKTKLFNAKNVKKDMLQLEVPIWVSDIKCFRNSESQIAVCTKYGHVRIYDTKAQRRPVINVSLRNQSLNALSFCANDNQIVTGSCTGFLLSVDIRGKANVLHSYKGATGSIRDVACVSSKPYIASVGLDRYLRIHHLESRTLLHKEYLKVRLNCVLMSKDFKDNETEQDNEEGSRQESDVECIDLEDNDEEYDEEYDEMFSKMENVGEKDDSCKPKRKKIKVK